MSVRRAFGRGKQEAAAPPASSARADGPAPGDGPAQPPSQGRHRPAGSGTPREAAERPALPRDEAAFAAMTVPVVPVTYAGQRRPARLIEDARLELLSRSNLDLLVDAAEDAGVEYFLLPDRRAHVQHAIAIVDTDAAAFGRALVARCAGRPVYLQYTGEAEWIGAADPSDLFGDRPALRVVELHRAGRKSMRLASNFGAHVELWERDEDGSLVARRRNPLTTRLTPALQQPATTTVPRSAGTPAGRTYRTLEPFTRRRMDEIDFDVDVVYTWVDGGDPTWRARKERRSAEFGAESLNPIAANASRWTDREELRYSLRSIEMFAPWVRRIFLVTDAQRPEWLVDEHPRLQVVDHREILPDSALPTFNSHAIESRLHHIEGLAEHYLYLNDDVMFGRPVPKSTFFLSNGTWRYFPSLAQVEFGDAAGATKPIDAAGINNRGILEELFGRTLTQKMKHTPHAARRSVLLELEQRLPEWFEATAHHPFRHHGDVSVATSLGHYYAYCTGRAVPGDALTYDYLDIAEESAAEKLPAWLDDRGLDVFCVNDTATSDEVHAQVSPLIAEFFTRYFPLKSTFEK